MSTTLDAIACCAPLSARALTDDEALATAELFRALGDPARVRIVNLIATAGSPVCACDFNDCCDIAQPTVSHHLRVLREAGLIEFERRGTCMHYRLVPDPLLPKLHLGTQLPAKLRFATPGHGRGEEKRRHGRAHSTEDWRARAWSLLCPRAPALLPCLPFDPNTSRAYHNCRTRRRSGAGWKVAGNIL